MKQSIEQKLRAEIKVLRRWKREAMQVMAALDAQAVGKELGLRLGTDVSSQVLPGIKRLKAQVSELEIRLAEARRRTIAFGGGEINFLPVYVAKFTPIQETVLVRSECGLPFRVPTSKRFELLVIADSVDVPQIAIAQKVGE